jgi:methionyl-tRNA formyltransferase
MNILFVCSSDQLVLPTILKLVSANHSLTIAVPQQYHKQISSFFLAAGIQANHIHSLVKQQLEADLNKLIVDHQINMALVFTFPWKLPAAVLSLPQYGFINLHGGILPKYKGPDPIFWQMKNGEQNGGITAHVMTEEIDAGPILLIQPLQIVPGETYGIHSERLAALAGETVTELVNKMAEGTLSAMPNNSTEFACFKKPRNMDTHINWQTQTATQIEALVNACNPRYKGALTTIKQMGMALLEVAPAAINNVPSNTLPGTIVYADNLYGLIVACRDGAFLKISITHSTAGYLSGTKLFQLGFKVGDKFE